MSTIISLIRRKLLYLKHAYSGFLILRRILNASDGRLVLVMGGIGIGDACIQGTYIKSFQEINQMPCVVVCKDSSVKVLRQMGINNIIGISYKELTQISTYYFSGYSVKYCRYQLRQGKLIITDPWYYTRTPLCQNIEGLNALNIVRDAALGLYDYTKEIQTMPHIVLNVEDIKSKYGIKSPFLIMNASSNSMNIDIQLFSAIANQLKTHNIYVYSNVIGDENPIDGTYALCCSIEELFCLCADALAIVSVRSGILDYIVSNAKCICAIYDDMQYYRFYSLKEWNTSAKIYEYRYQKGIPIDEDIVVRVLFEKQSQQLDE